ncbi:hypothetical protein [Aliikangiella coralliicola]|uniref:Uncharacterized protein n=1 Tax=Aliikangiella coralliicola TaxID=2592383 RepID=A0A545UDT4_9GAMM|nr:hypothetical protein [Aliikangiella coralliicola]TQV87619.1 hypothetical protein FLL46_12170 [Aliikangiella coralliicola]
MKKLSLCFLLLLVSYSADGEEITDESFVGKWCGKWDNVYSLCVTIDSIDSDAKAKYEWAERADGELKQGQKKIVRVNLNTLRLENIYFALDENNPEQANAMGIFQIRTRLAKLTKSVQ